MAFSTTKTWGHECGLSVAFRQWRADSHCRVVHGYAVSISVTFEAEELDHRGWVIDFGGLKDLKAGIAGLFDHKLLVAEDDPHLEWFKHGHDLGLCDLVIVPAVGCEHFAKLVHALADVFLIERELRPRVRVSGVLVSEHGANTAGYYP